MPVNISNFLAEPDKTRLKSCLLLVFTKGVNTYAYGKDGAGRCGCIWFKIVSLTAFVVFINNLMTSAAIEMPGFGDIWLWLLDDRGHCIFSGDDPKIRKRNFHCIQVKIKCAT